MPGSQRTILRLLAESAARRPHHVAVEDLPAGRCTYAELDALSDGMRDRLRHMGVRRGDRVAIGLRKSIDSYEKLIGEHEIKLKEYMEDPFAHDNQGLLQNAPNDRIRQKIIQGRIQALQREINIYRKNIEKLRRLLDD